MIRVGNPIAFFRVAPIVATGLFVAGCGAGPTISVEEAGARIAAWLPGAEVSIVDSTAQSGGAVVAADVSGESLTFRFSHAEPGWSLDGMLVDGDTLDRAGTKAAWREILLSPRELTLAQMAAGQRPLAPLEVVVTGLRVVSVTEERMELESTSDPDIGHVVVNGRHFDNLPMEVGQSIAIQLQGLGRDGDDWVPERNTIANELLVELDPIDVTFLALLKLRLPEQVVPVPYAIPDMDHDHGEGTSG